MFRGFILNLTSTQLSSFGLTPALEKKFWCTFFATLPGLSQLPCNESCAWSGQN